MAVISSINEDSIALLVDRFYACVRRDPLLGPVFNGVIGDRWPEHLATLTDFWSSVLLGSGRYKGSPMMAHFALPQMDRDHFERWIELWRETTREIFDQEISAALVTRAQFMGERLVQHSSAQQGIPPNS